MSAMNSGNQEKEPVPTKGRMTPSTLFRIMPIMFIKSAPAFTPFDGLSVVGVLAGMACLLVSPFRAELAGCPDLSRTRGSRPTQHQAEGQRLLMLHACAIRAINDGEQQVHRADADLAHGLADGGEGRIEVAG